MGRPPKGNIILPEPESQPPAPKKIKVAAIPPEQKYAALLQTKGIGCLSLAVSRGCHALRDYIADASRGCAGLQEVRFWLQYVFHTCLLTTRFLLQNAYVHISQVPILVMGDAAPTMLSICNCAGMADARASLVGLDAARYRRLEVMACGEPLSMDARCLAVQAYARLVRARAITVMEDEQEAVVLQASPLTVSFSESGCFDREIIIADKNNHLACQGHACRHWKHACVHVGDFAAWMDRTDNLETAPFAGNFVKPSEHARGPPPEMLPKRPSVSQLPIAGDYVSAAARRRLSPGVGGGWLDSPAAHCVPPADGSSCTCGGAWDSRDPVEQGWIAERGATLYGTNAALPVTVFYRPCTACDAKQPYDGHHEGVFNYSNKTLFLHEVMSDYVHGMAECRMPFYAYYSILRRRYAQLAHSTMCARSTLMRALQSYFTILDIDFAASFECPCCSKLPMSERVIVGDGKAMGFLRATAQPPVFRERGGAAPGVTGVAMTYLRGGTGTGGLQQLVRQYASGKQLGETEFGKMVRLAEKQQRPELAAALLFTKQPGPGGELTCPASYQLFLGSISTPYPVSTLLPHSMIFPPAGSKSRMSPLRRIYTAATIVPTDRTLLLNQVPTLYDMVSKNGWSSIPTQFRGVLEALEKLAAIPGSVRDAAQPVEDGLPQDNAYDFFPQFPIARKLRTYPKDPSPKDSPCNTEVKRHAHLTPGIFGIFCPHGICLGFQAMHRFEGASTLFEILVQRFPEMPGTIIYDNACNLSKYCLTREPTLFSRVKFFVDRVHWAGHVGCHRGFCMDAYPKTLPVMGMTLGDINSQVCEQGNSKMELIAVQTKYMRQDTYMDYVKLFLHLANAEVAAKM